MQGQSLPTPPIAKSSTESSPLSADVFPEIRSSKQPQIEATTDPGTLQLRESGTSYVQSVHWEAVLTKIRGLKEESLPDPKGLPGSHLFYGPSRHATRDEIMAAIPPRSKADQLLAFHFDSHIITPCQYIWLWFDSGKTLTGCCRSHSSQEVSPRGEFFLAWPIPMPVELVEAAFRNVKDPYVTLQGCRRFVLVIFLEIKQPGFLAALKSLSRT